MRDRDLICKHCGGDWGCHRAVDSLCPGTPTIGRWIGQMDFDKSPGTHFEQEGEE